MSKRQSASSCKTESEFFLQSLLQQQFFVRVSARASALSIAQTKEVEMLLKNVHDNVSFQCSFLESTGDKSLHVSLRSIGRTDFFTKEIDDLVLQGKADVAIHSAKDLPYPLTEGLEIVAITEGKAYWDSLVLAQAPTPDYLQGPLLIAASSERREVSVRALIPHARFVDVRGTIEKRLQKVFTEEVDGVVVAEAALERLALTDLNRLRLEGDIPWGQGKLAVVAKAGNRRMQELFTLIDSGCREDG